MSEEIDVGMKCIKYMLFVSNFMFVMIGFLLISIGSTIKAIYGDFDQFMSDHYFSPATLAVAIGVIIFFVALFGCVGALKESTMLINVFAFLLTLLLILEVSAAIAAYAVRGKLDTEIRDKMTASAQSYYSNEYDRDIWDFTQARLYCCGIDNYQSWTPYFSPLDQTSPSEDSQNLSSTPAADYWYGPQSCCRPGRPERDYCLTSELYTDGCLDDLIYLVSESSLLLGCGALAVSFIQFLGIIFASMLAKAVRRIKTQRLVDKQERMEQTYEQLAKEQKLDVLATPVMYTPTYSEA